MDKQIIVAAAKVFGVAEEVIASHVQELEKAPIALVEYPEFLKGERKHEYDARRENIGVYTGEIKTLVKGLKTIGGQSVAGLTPWEIIFTYFKQITPDLMSKMEQENISKAEERRDVEESPVVTEETTPNKIEMPDERHAERVEETPVVTEDHVREEAITPTVNEPAKEESTPKWESDIVSCDNINEQGTAKCTTNSEVHEMADTTNLTDIAKQIVAGNEGATTEAPKTKTSSKPQKLDKELQADIAAAFTDTDARYAYVRNNHIVGMIATAKSVKDRLVVATGIKGVLADAGAAADAAKVITEKLNNKMLGHVKKITGDKNMTVEKWTALPDDQKYANCVTEDDKIMAQFITDAIKEAMADNAKQFDLIAPVESNVAFKGLKVGSMPVSKDALTTLLVDNTPGALFGEGMVDEGLQYTPVGKDKDKLVQVSLTVRQVNPNNTKQTNEIVTTGNGKKSVTVAQLKGRKALQKDGKIEYIFPEVNKGATRNASLLVELAGKPATFKYFKRDENGNKIQVGKEGEKHDATATASLKGVGKVFEVVKEMAAGLAGDRTPKQAHEYWGLTYKAVKDENQALSLNFDESPVFAALTVAGVAESMKDAKSKTALQIADLIKSKGAAEASAAGAALNI
jgi:hypothetical protein